ncbi:MAG: M48 family metalloprotease [Sphingosinicella sp.]|uniref:M48 family metalloprotease n=1 Tax=Sphingosinicella sp. TaxID=1917971 RepID=UPI00403836EE
MATIGHRLAIGNRELCRNRQWLTGIALHDLSQYGVNFRDAAIRAFGLDAGPAVLAIAAGSPAERDGLRQDDVITAIDGDAPPRHELETTGGFEAMERILDALDSALADGTVNFTLRRGGDETIVTVRAERGCATRFQLIPSPRLNAYADGRYVQVTTAISDYVANDDELAAVLAHEFAHNVLRHRARLDAAGVARGFLGNFGRNARLIRETEAEADRLSIHLLDRAGYNPAAAIRLWSRFGRRGLNIFGSPTHGNWQSRVAAMESELEAIRRARAAGAVATPPFVEATQP